MPDPGRGRRGHNLVAPSVVIPWRDEGDRGECLRYSLRSLVNLPHSRVLIVGDPLPDWAVGIENITLPRAGPRWDDSEASVQAGLAKVDGWAYISHDDFVVARPVDLIAPSHRGPLGLYRSAGEYYRRARRVAAWLERAGYPSLNYNTHMPCLVEASVYIELVGSSALPAGFGLSIYGNLRRLVAPKIIDPKVVATGSRPHPSWPVWSTSDRSFARGWIGREIRTVFSEPGPYG